MKISFFGYSLELNLSFKRKPTLFTNGITNITQDRMFVLFADYDMTNLEVVEEDAKFLQSNYDLGDLIIARSSKEHFNKDYDIYSNYHLIGLTKLPFEELKSILRNLRCDFHFKQGWKYQQRNWVLRLGYKRNLKTGDKVKGKPTLESFMPARTDRTYSHAHVSFFNKFYNLKINHKNKDQGFKVKLIDYVTR